MKVEYAVFNIVLSLSLISTLRLSFDFELIRGRRLLELISHPVWLVPLMFIVMISIGMFLQGTLSPWPPSAYHQYAGMAGLGYAAFLISLITNIWILYTPGQILCKYAISDLSDKGKKVRLFNLIFGLLIVSCSLAVSFA